MYIIETISATVQTHAWPSYISPKEWRFNAIRLRLLTFDKQRSFRRNLQHGGMQPVNPCMEKITKITLHGFNEKCSFRERGKEISFWILIVEAARLEQWGCTRSILAEQLILNVPRTPAHCMWQPGRSSQTCHLLAELQNFRLALPVREQE